VEYRRQHNNRIKLSVDAVTSVRSSRVVLAPAAAYDER